MNSSMSASDGWQVSEVALTTRHGQRVAAGWVRGHFGLDFRVMLNGEDQWEGGWAITHLPTGYAVRRVFADLSTAKAFTNAVAELGDWSFTATDQHTLSPLGKAVKQVTAAFPEVEIVGPVTREIAPFNMTVSVTP